VGYVDAAAARHGSRARDRLFTQLTCFTGTKVQILTQQLQSEARLPPSAEGGA
jgi:hypothetical protein